MDKTQEIIQQLQSEKQYYDSENYSSEYYSYLFEDTDQIGINLSKIYFGNDWDKLTNTQIDAIIEDLRASLGKYIDTFNSWYVGYNCVTSVSFGEIEIVLDNQPELSDEDIRVIEHETDLYYGETSKSWYYNKSDEGTKISLTKDQIQEILNELEL